MNRPRATLWSSTLLLLAGLATSTLAADPFYLKDGDRVVFYGDSITDQRLYTTFVETYVVTRFPRLNVTFVHSGWGGDRVTGGGGGPIDVRLKRDVFAYKPTVMTVMLGMNDASYQPFKQEIFDTYSKGYDHIVKSVKSEFPDIRMTLIVPSPFDDVTQQPRFEGGYNAVLLKYGDFVRDLASKNNLDVADLNTSVVDATKVAFAKDPTNATKLNPDRVHPAPGGQLLMAAALLKAWHAPALVDKVAIRIEGDAARAETQGSEVADLAVNKGTLTWTERDSALPFPLNLKDPVVNLAVQSSDVLPTLDAQTLQVTGLPDGNFTLKIDGKEVTTVPSSALSAGLNLSNLSTPMVAQAEKVHQLTLEHNNLHFNRWRQIQVPYEKLDPAAVSRAMEALDAIEADLVKKQHDAAQPTEHKFELVPRS